MSSCPIRLQVQYPWKETISVLDFLHIDNYQLIHSQIYPNLSGDFGWSASCIATSKNSSKLKSNN